MVEEKQYKISEMTKKVQVEAHVLRYWEEELQLPIKRNNLGHRYYTEEDVERFLQIKQLKERGIQLKGIRSMLDLPVEELESVSGVDSFGRKPVSQSIVMKLPAADYGGTNLALENGKEEKAYRLQMLLKGLVKEAVAEIEDLEEEDEDDDTYYEVTCPSCNETICLDEETLLDGGIACPNCGEELEFDFDCDGECDGCDSCDED